MSYRIFSFIWNTLTESLNHRIFEVGRNLRRSSSLTCFIDSQRESLSNLSGQPVPNFEPSLIFFTQKMYSCLLITFTFSCKSISLVLESAELDPAFWVLPHQCWVEGKDHFPAARLLLVCIQILVSTTLPGALWPTYFPASLIPASLCWRLGYSSPRAGLCTSLFCTSGDSYCHISLACPWFLWMSAQTSGVPTNSLIFVSLDNILKRHSAPSSKSLMKLLNHAAIPRVPGLVTDLQLDMYSWTQFFEHGRSASFQPSSLSIYPVFLQRYYGRQCRKLY